MAQNRADFPYRARNNWGGGDLPAPFAEGDIVDVPAGARALERLYDGGPGYYVVTYGPSIDEGDGWYFRLHNGSERQRSDRLHVAFADRSTFPEDINWMEGVELVDTADPEGLSERERLLADGWSYPPRVRCPHCGGSGFVNPG
jgi:hypothetical protein